MNLKIHRLNSVEMWNVLGWLDYNEFTYITIVCLVNKVIRIFCSYIVHIPYNNTLILCNYIMFILLYNVGDVINYLLIINLMN